MKQAQQLGVQGRYDALAPVLSKTYDIASMTRMAVGQSWDSLQPAQKAALTQAFSRMMIATYAKRFDGFSGETFQIVEDYRPRPERQDGQDPDRPEQRQAGRDQLLMRKTGPNGKSSTSISTAPSASSQAAGRNSRRY